MFNVVPQSAITSDAVLLWCAPTPTPSPTYGPDSLIWWHQRSTLALTPQEYLDASGQRESVGQAGGEVTDDGGRAAHTNAHEVLLLRAGLQSEHPSPGSPDTGWGAYSFCCSIPLVYHLQKRAASWSADIDMPNCCSPHAQARVHAAVFKRRIPFQGLCS